VILAQMTTAFGQTALPSQDGFRVVLAIGAGAALLAFTVASFIPRQRAAEGVAEATTKATTAATEAVEATGAREATEAPASEGPVAVAGVPVRGRVLGAERVPVAGAAVTLISLGGKQLGRTVSWDDGSYDVGAPGAGSYVLIASSEGYQPQASTVVVADEPVAYDVLLSGTSGLAGVCGPRTAGRRSPRPSSS
jgi:hypothetical protein